MSKPKYSSEFKIMVAEAYLNGEGGFQHSDEYRRVKPGKNDEYVLDMWRQVLQNGMYILRHPAIFGVLEP